ncbi:MAG: cis-L-3-hydroxyproline dehydratase [Pseudonocardiales bacterium]|nr:cis-L-3-hydroxyproline dehydratase [Pseudonocardiales bacterium]
MKIAQVQVFEYDAAWVYGEFRMSRGRSAPSHRSLVVRVVTDEGLDGWAETCPNGRTYLPSFLEGERAALVVLAEAVVGLDPRNLARLTAAMDEVLLGSHAAKGALDVACWDILGQAVGLPVCELLGGRLQETFPLFVAVPVDTLQSMPGYVARELAAGVRVFQVKAGDDPTADVARVRAVLDAAGPDSTVIVDANGGWNLQAALQAVRALDGLPVRIEQPCRTMTDCAEVRRRMSLPMILDECVVGIEDLMLAKFTAGASGINLKTSRVGGLTKARAMRDAAQGLGMTFTVDDTWGGALTTAQNAHLAASSRPDSLTASTFFSEWVQPCVASGLPSSQGGRGSAPDAPGLGIMVDLDLLTAPVLDL